MNVKEAIHTRRAVKHFDVAHIMSDAEQAELFNLAQQTPSSFNIQHWRIVNARDPELRKALRAAAWDQAQVTDASMLLIICADVKAWEKNPERNWENAPKETQDFLVPMIGTFYEGKEQLQRDEALRSVGFIAQTLMLAAKGMGYDTSPMIGFDAAKVAELINLPPDHVIGMMLAVGKAAKPAQPKGGILPRSAVVVDNRF
ncbi:MAG TPA: nitroreductase family protein [Alphaproteobacteria bacterium]|nr:nitroreductase family protein [Alphaproteobacteria bacterium]